MPNLPKKKSTLTLKEQKLRCLNSKITSVEGETIETSSSSSNEGIQFVMTRSKNQKQKLIAENSQCVNNRLKKLRKTKFCGTYMEEKDKNDDSSDTDQDEVRRLIFLHSKTLFNMAFFG